MRYEIVTMYSKTDQGTVVTKKLMEIVQNEVKFRMLCTQYLIVWTFRDQIDKSP